MCAIALMTGKKSDKGVGGPDGEGPWLKPGRVSALRLRASFRQSLLAEAVSREHHHRRDQTRVVHGIIGCLDAYGAELAGASERLFCSSDSGC